MKQQNPNRDAARAAPAKVVAHLLGKMKTAVLALLALVMGLFGVKCARTTLDSRRTAHLNHELPSGRTVQPAAIAAVSKSPAYFLPDDSVVLRQQALDFLDRLLNQVPAPSEPLPELDLHPEDTATPDEKKRILDARTAAERDDVLLIVARLPDGTLHFDESREDFPTIELVPPHLRQHLTPQDWEDFQIKIKVASLKSSVLRIMEQNKRPTKPPEPTPVSVTPRATDEVSK